MKTKYHLTIYKSLLLLTVTVLPLFASSSTHINDSVHIRINAAGYLPSDRKVAIAFSMKPLKGNFTLIEKSSGKNILAAKIKLSAAPGF